MDFADILQILMDFLYQNLVQPILNFLLEYGQEITHLDLLSLNFGFGEVIWFSLSFYDFILIVIGLMVSITALILTWKFIKFLNGFLKGLFTGIKR